MFITTPDARRLGRTNQPSSSDHRHRADFARAAVFAEFGGHARAHAAEVVADLQRRRHVQQVHRLGDRVFGELLAEIGAERGITTIIDQKLERYAELDPETLQATGGDDFWPAPLREV